LSGIPLKIGAIIEGTIADLNERGQGVIDHPFRPVLVPNTLPGEVVRARITHLGGHRAAATVESVVSASNRRIAPICHHAHICGGCDLAHADYKYQLEWKADLVNSTMKKAGVAMSPSGVDPIAASPKSLHYRNKLIFQLQFSHPRVIAGLFMRHSHKTIDIDNCPLQEDPINQAVPLVKQAIIDRRWPIYNESKKTGSLRSFSLRSGTEGDLLLTLIAKRMNLPGLEEQAATWLREIPGLAGVLVNINAEETNRIFSGETVLIDGAETITSTLGSLHLQVEPTAFHQVNVAQTEQMIKAVSKELGKCDRLIDAYCGTGVLGLSLARHVDKLFGIDVDSQAVAAAVSNAARNHIHNAEFIEGDVDDVLPGIIHDSSHGRSTVLLDPPRKGLSKSVRTLLASSPVAQIIYVSCNPASLARDLVELIRGGYQIDRLQPFDMFPQTRHVECLAFLSR